MPETHSPAKAAADSRAAQAQTKAGKQPETLAGRCIWLTRPRYQCSALRQALEARGATVVPLPMFEIERVPANPTLKHLILNLDHYELVFFISTNAARMGMDFIEQFWPQLPAGQQYFSVGPSTAEALAEYGVVAHFPTKGMNSEALLALPALQGIVGKKALIVRGVGGREILANGLRERGVRVDYAEVYQRRLPDYPESYLRSATEQACPDAVVISSVEALVNFVELLSPLWPALRQCRLFVSSERIAEEARERNFEQLELMPGASDSVILDALGAKLARISGQSEPVSKGHE